MARTQVTEGQFEIRENEGIHDPTGARWTLYPGRAAPNFFSRGKLGYVLPHGADYRPEDVERIALGLLASKAGANDV